METWISVIISTALSTLVGIIVGKIVNKRIDKRTNDRKLREQEDKKIRNEEMRTCIKEELTDIKIDLKNISKDLKLNTKGTVTLLRDIMKNSHREFIKQGWIESEDRINWHELYKAYSDLGGNHFREYVNDWKNDIDKLPDKPQTKKVITE